jgi:hypothetical protein
MSLEKLRTKTPFMIVLKIPKAETLDRSLSLLSRTLV